MSAAGRSPGFLSRSCIFPALRDCCSFILAALLSQQSWPPALPASCNPSLGCSEPQTLPDGPPGKDPRNDDDGLNQNRGVSAIKNGGVLMPQGGLCSPLPWPPNPPNPATAPTSCPPHECPHGTLTWVQNRPWGRVLSGVEHPGGRCRPLLSGHVPGLSLSV